MSRIIDSDDMRYTKRHEWVHLEDMIATIGITDHAQSELPGINLVEMPAEDGELNAGDEAANVESQRDYITVSAPLDGRVVEVNSVLEDSPEIINQDPYGNGWIFRLELTDASSWQDLLTAEEYEDYLSGL
jgi:glycine cleavage system H protein